MSLKRLLFVCSFALFFSASNAVAGLDRCRDENPNNVLTPSGDIAKEDICNQPIVDSYRSLYYYSGPKAFCGDNKAVYCAHVDYEIKRRKPIDIGSMDERGALPLEQRYWYKAANYCGIDANAIHAQYCESYAKEGGWNGSYDFELICKPEQVSAFADRQCAGREYTTGRSSSDNAFCGRNYKGKLDPRFKKNAMKDKPKFDKSGWTACEPVLGPQMVKKGQPKPTVQAPSSNSSSSGSSSSSNGSNTPSAPAEPSSPAPGGVGDALNKAKKLKDVFGF